MANFDWNELRLFRSKPLYFLSIVTHSPSRGIYAAVSILFYMLPRAGATSLVIAIFGELIRKHHQIIPLNGTNYLVTQADRTCAHGPFHVQPKITQLQLRQADNS